MDRAKTIICNGPLGCCEHVGFEAGTRAILHAMAEKKSAQTVIGGGDTLDAMAQFEIPQTAFSHVSTGGGAMLLFLEGANLPGIEVLETE
jgi:phosphoglycerate kinase